MSELLTLASEFTDLQYSPTKSKLVGNQANCIGYCRQLLTSIDPEKRLFVIENQNGRNITARVCEINVPTTEITMVGISHMGTYSTTRSLSPSTADLVLQPGFKLLYDDLDQRVISTQNLGNPLLFGKLLDPEAYFLELLSGFSASAPWMSVVKTARNFGLE